MKSLTTQPQASEKGSTLNIFSHFMVIPKAVANMNIQVVGHILLGTVLVNQGINRLLNRTTLFFVSFH